MLQEYMNKGIKDVISKFPAVADILEQYNIGCAVCTEGSCLLKDIVDVHNLSPEDERALMAQMAEVIDSGGRTETPAVKRSPQATPKQTQYSPPLRQLVDEHILIKRWLALIPKSVENLDVESEEGRGTILAAVDFIRSYADKYHHAKEEDILFKYFDEDSDILRAMCADHEKGRSHVRAVLEALERRDRDAIAEHLSAYGELLAGHILKEDEILYRWMDRNLSMAQVGELFSKFAEVEDRMDKNVINRCRAFVVKLEEQLQESREKVAR